jgi:hypothetical protein
LPYENAHLCAVAACNAGRLVNPVLAVQQPRPFDRPGFERLATLPVLRNLGQKAFVEFLSSCASPSWSRSEG